MYKNSVFHVVVPLVPKTTKSPIKIHSLLILLQEDTEENAGFMASQGYCVHLCFLYLFLLHIKVKSILSSFLVLSYIRPKFFECEFGVEDFENMILW